MTRLAVLAAFLVCVGLTARSSRAQVLVLDEDFSRDPFANGWVRNGFACWVPPLPEEESCETLGLDPGDCYGDEVEDCTLHPEKGYVVLTPAFHGDFGNMFFGQRLLLRDFKVTAVVEIRDGSFQRPGDGMCLVVVGLDAPPAFTGSGGGGMGATGLGRVPTLVLELDIACDNTGDFSFADHIGLTWSRVGLSGSNAPCSPALPYCRNDAFVPLDATVFPLHNRLPPPAPPNRFEVELEVRDATAVCRLRRLDDPHDFGELFVLSLAGFPAGGFEGYLGFTASSFRESHVIHSVRIELPPVCPPPAVRRDLQPSRTPEEASGDYLPGDVIPVVLTIGAVPAAGGECGAVTAITVRESPPSGWLVSDVSDGGVYPNPGHPGAIAWTISGADLAEGKALTYHVTAPEGSGFRVAFSGEVSSAGAPGESVAIVGEDVLTLNTPFDDCGGLRSWNILGAYAVEDFFGPNLALDYLTDGSVSESEFVWFPGAQIETAFGGDGVGGGAASTGLLPNPLGRNPGGTPTVFAWNDPDSVVNLNDEALGGNPDSALAYAQVYVQSLAAEPMEVYFGIASDDAMLVVLNGEAVGGERSGGFCGFAPGDGGADACSPQRVIGPHALRPGDNSLLVKVSDIIGAFGFSLRFEDALGRPITAGLAACKFQTAGTEPLQARRAFDTGETLIVQCVELQVWRPEEQYDVTLSLSDFHLDPSGCRPRADAVTITDTVPEGWTPSDPSHGGVVDGRSVSWTLAGAELVPGVLSYRVQASGALGRVRFQGTVTVPGSRTAYSIAGMEFLVSAADFSAQGFIQNWLFLGPYLQPGIVVAGGTPPEDEMRQDHLTDGAGITERNVEPRAGDTVNTAYDSAGPARSTGLAPPATPTGINPGGVPTWKGWRDLDDTIDFGDFYSGDLSGVMMYALTYVSVAERRTVDLGLASSDSIQVLLDGEEIHLRQELRGIGEANSVQDVVRGVELAPGSHRLMVKVFEGLGPHGFRLRFQDPESGRPLTDGIDVCLSPDLRECSGENERFVRGDTDSSGIIDLTDGIVLLSYLFTGAAPPACLDAADTDDSGELLVTDAIVLFGWLFLGTAPPLAPSPRFPGYGPVDCRRDPTPGDQLDCSGLAGICGA